MKRMGCRMLASLLMGLGLSACDQKEPLADPVWKPEILETRPHDMRAYTQGLLIDGDRWFESTGNYGESELRELDPVSGGVRRRHRLKPRYFGEGLALHGGSLYQLTWREGVCFRYEPATFVEQERFRYAGEGWGLCSDGKNLLMSTGSSRISMRDPESFKEIGSFQVVGAAGAVNRLNELEMVRGELWANVWRTGWIVRIEPKTGRVLGFVDLHALPLPADRHADDDVLNGIAWDENTGALWVTGKRWRAAYRISLPPDLSSAQ